MQIINARYSLLMMLLFNCTALAQGSPPPGYTDNVDEQMAKMQVQVRYGGFLEKLSVSDSRRTQIASLITGVFVQRNAASRDISAGRATAVTMEEMTSTKYLRQRLIGVLNSEEISEFDEFELNYQQVQLRNNFNSQLSLTAPDLSEANREVVLTILMKHMGAGQTKVSSSGGGAVDESQRQLQALMNARREIILQLSQEQMQETEKFLSRIQSGLMTSQSMNETTN